MRYLLNLIRNILLFPGKLINTIQFKLQGVRTETIQTIGVITLSNAGVLTIGRNTKINSSTLKNVIGGDTRTSLVVQKGATFTIGDEVKISNSAFQCAESITIGDYVMIGGSCKIWDSDFHSLDAQVRRNTPNHGAKTAAIVIEDDVFVGGGSMILKGVTIGAKSIIAAGSVVSKSIPSGEIWGGNPAKFIRTID